MLLIDDYLLYKLLVEPPIAMARMMCESICDMCNRELTDEGTVHEKLLELQLRHELDEITEEEYQKEEAVLMARLRKIREAKQQEMWGEDTNEVDINPPLSPFSKVGFREINDEGGDSKKEYI